jgi:hypothetical protein
MPAPTIDLDSIDIDAIDLDSGFARRLLARMVGDGRAIPLNTETTSVQKRLNQFATYILDLHAGHASPALAPEATDLALSCVDEALGIYGQGTPRPKGIFQPQRDGLPEAMITLVAGKREKSAVFYNVSFDVGKTEAQAVKAKALMGYERVLARHLQRVENHAWVIEVDLYQTASTTWKVVGPVFERDDGLREWGTNLYKYMTERAEKAKETKEDREAVEKAVAASKAAEAKARAEKEAREKTADDLADAFVRALEERRGRDRDR